MASKHQKHFSHTLCKGFPRFHRVVVLPLCSRVHAATIFIIVLTMKHYKYQLHHLISPPDFELFKDGIYAIVQLCNPDE